MVARGTSRRLRCLTAFAFALAVLGRPAPARATGDYTPLIVAYAVLTGGFEAYDVGSAVSEGKHDVVLVAQTAVFPWLAVPAQLSLDDPRELWELLVPAWLNQLTLYPAYAWVAEPSLTSLGASFETGVNVSLTFAALRLSARDKARARFWLPELLLTSPQIGVAAYQLTRASDDWSVADIATVGNGAWASLLFLDGVLNAIRPRRSSHARSGAASTADGWPDIFLADTALAALRPDEQRWMLNARARW